MRLDLEGQVIAFVKGDDPGVIDKGRANPGLIDLLGGGAQIGLEQAVNLLLDRVGIRRCAGQRPRVANVGAEGLVNAVLGPGLCQHFEFGIAGVASILPEIAADGLHLVQVQRQPPFRAQVQQLLVVTFADGNPFDSITAGGVLDERRRNGGVDALPLDNRIRQQPRHRLQGFSAQVTLEQVALPGGGPLNSGDAKMFGSQSQIIGDGIGHTRQQGHVDDVIGLYGQRVDAVR